MEFKVPEMEYDVILTEDELITLERTEDIVNQLRKMILAHNCTYLYTGHSAHEIIEIEELAKIENYLDALTLVEKSV